MPADFPDNPTIGQEFQISGRSWTWNGSTWDAVLEAAAIPLFATTPLAFDASTRTVSIDLSSYYTSSQTDTFLNLKKDEINQTLSSDTTLVAGYRYFVDTSAARTLTLPAAPAVGDEIQLFDASGTGSTNNVTINNNSNKINGTLDTALIDIDGFATVFVWTGSTYGWRMI